MATFPETEAPLLDDVVHGAVDCNGHAVRRSTSGGWRSAWFIIWVEVAERIAFFGICANLISFLTGPLGQSTATAAKNVNMWVGTASLLPLLGAFVADSLLGRYRTVIAASLLYILGLGLLTLSAVLPSSQLQKPLFFFSLYLVAVGQGGHKPCVQAFGADQFDRNDQEESKAKSSFFNWWFFCLSAAPLFTLPVLVYIQDNLSWSLGFGILCILMVLSLLIFILGTRNYRYSLKGDDESPIVRIGKVFVAAIRNWRTSSLAIASIEEARGNLSHQSSQQFKYLKISKQRIRILVEKLETMSFSDLSTLLLLMYIFHASAEISSSYKPFNFASDRSHMIYSELIKWHPPPDGRVKLLL